MGGCRNTLSSWLGAYAQNELHCHPGSVDAMHFALAHMSSSGKKSLHPLIQATKHLHRVTASAHTGNRTLFFSYHCIHSAYFHLAKLYDAALRNSIRPTKHTQRDPR